MDVSAFTQNETCDVVIINPITGEPTDCVITVYSTDTKVYRKTQLLIAKGEVDKDEAAEFLLASLTKSWVNVEDGKDAIECTQANAIKLYNDCPFIYEQIERVIFNRVKFMKVQPKA